MESVVFLLHPAWLENPDIDLRYLIPEALEKLSSDELKIIEDGYEHDQEGDYMYIFMKVDDSGRFLKVINSYLSDHEILGNRILDSCIISKEIPGGYEVLYRFHPDANFKEPPLLFSKDS